MVVMYSTFRENYSYKVLMELWNCVIRNLKLSCQLQRQNKVVWVVQDAAVSLGSIVTLAVTQTLPDSLSRWVLLVI